MGEFIFLTLRMILLFWVLQKATALMMKVWWIWKVTSCSKIYDYNLALGASHVLLDGSILFGFGHYRGSKAGEKVQFNNLSVTQTGSNCT